MKMRNQEMIFRDVVENLDCLTKLALLKERYDELDMNSSALEEAFEDKTIECEDDLAGKIPMWCGLENNVDITFWKVRNEYEQANMEKYSDEELVRFIKVNNAFTESLLLTPIPKVELEKFIAVFNSYGDKFYNGKWNIEISGETLIID